MRVFLLHGLGQGPDSWIAAAENLLPKAELVCPDLAAWVREGADCYDRLYGRMETLLQREEEPAVLCGLSLGGVLALEYAARHPERAAKLVLIGTPYKVPKGALRMQNALFRLMPKSAFRGTGLGKQEMLALSRSMENLDPSQWAAQAVCPALVLCGERDKTNRSSAQMLAEKLPRARLAWVPGAGHEVNRDAPEALAKLLNEFLWEEDVG